MGMPEGDIHDFSRYPPQDLIALLGNPFERRYGQIARVLGFQDGEVRLRFGYDPFTNRMEPQEAVFCLEYHRI